MASNDLGNAESDSDDDLPVNQFAMKSEAQTDSENDKNQEEMLDLNMTVEAEGENENIYTTNKIIMGKMRAKKKFTKRIALKNKIKKKKSTIEDEDGGTTSDHSSTSDTDGEIEIPILGEFSPPIVHHHQYFKSFKFGPPPNMNQLSEIKLPVGEPITVVTIKQEYDEDDECQPKENIEPVDEKPDIKQENDVKLKVKHRKNKAKIELSEEDLVALNIRFEFTCQVCNAEYPESAALKEHMQSHEQVGTYMCGSCQRVYQDIEHLRSHMLCHVKGGNHKCEECGKVYHHSQSLMSHRKRWHAAERPHFCHACGKSFSLKNDLTTHMKSHSDDKFPCLYCDKSFRTDRYLRIHTKHIHLGHKFARIECKVCHKSFQKKNLLTHMKLHENKVHKCHYCGKCMTTSYSLIAHIRRHEGIKPFVCEICNKAFVDKGKLSRHVHSHKGTRDFQCDICEKSFSESQYLRQHKRTHDHSREYPCRVCGTKFKSMNSVWSHMRKHTHTNRYECQYCGKTCYRPDHLRSHLISHTGIKEFQCEICSKRFAKAYDLTEHRRGHSGERPYHCRLCNRAFARHGEFRKHRMSKYHREREIEAGLTPSFPPAQSEPGTGRPSASHHCPVCDKRFSTAPGLAAHLRRKSHLAKTGRTPDTTLEEDPGPTENETEIGT